MELLTLENLVTLAMLTLLLTDIVQRRYRKKLLAQRAAAQGRAA